jgi:hypothetical protein
VGETWMYLAMIRLMLRKLVRMQKELASESHYYGW